MSDDVGSLLLRAGMIAPQQLEEARNIATKIGGTVPEQLVFNEALDDEELTRFYCRQLLIPRINPSQLAKLSPRLLEKLPADMAREFRSIPAMLDTDGNLTVVMSDPSDTKVADEIGFFTGSYIVRAIATQAQIAWCLAHYFDHITPLHKKLVEEGQWPKDRSKIEPAPSKDRAKTEPTQKKSSSPEDSDELTTGPLAREKREAKLGTARRRSKRRGAIKRPTNQQPSPPELIDRAGEIITPTKSRPRKLSMQPAVVIAEAPPSIVISVEADSNAVPHVIEKGTDTSPFLLSIDLPKIADPDPILLSNVAAKTSGTDSSPIVLGAKGKTIRRASRNTFAGIGSLGSESASGPWEEALAQHSAGTRDPLRDTIQMKTISDFEGASEESGPHENDGEGEKTNPEKFVVKLPMSMEDSDAINADDMLSDDDWELPKITPLPQAADNSNSVPIVIDDRATIRMTPLPEDDYLYSDAEDTSQDDLPGAAVSDEEDEEGEDEKEDGAVDQAADIELSAGIASKVLGSLRTIDRATDKGEVVESLLSFLDLAFERCGFLALRNQELSPWRLHGCSPNSTTSIDVSGESTFGELIRMRLPYTGEIADESAKQLANDLEFPEARNLLAIPMLVKGRVLGVLFGLSRNTRLFEEHVAVLAEAASEAFERIILAKRS